MLHSLPFIGSSLCLPRLLSLLLSPILSYIWEQYSEAWKQILEECVSSNFVWPGSQAKVQAAIFCCLNYLNQHWPRICCHGWRLYYPNLHIGRVTHLSEVQLLLICICTLPPPVLLQSSSIEGADAIHPWTACVFSCYHVCYIESTCWTAVYGMWASKHYTHLLGCRHLLSLAPPVAQVNSIWTELY